MKQKSKSFSFIKQVKLKSFAHDLYGVKINDEDEMIRRTALNQRKRFIENANVAKYINDLFCLIQNDQSCPIQASNFSNLHVGILHLNFFVSLVNEIVLSDQNKEPSNTNSSPNIISLKYAAQTQALQKEKKGRKIMQMAQVHIT
ncbi:hypothetical protein HELRODRAFT_161254 [Helobdella robusta]|uniref:Uncharacterized protein n=1 Tax=Helobdella robusta TaxID=6412 RepID=T1ER95_HELRO|nr:hypothetical protein HELRODRAFT_161254 [Helobdella robusta]ESO02030.1 hypothetical protein HELRODRAFT_161254 [Helobdella robusta]